MDRAAKRRDAGGTVTGISLNLVECEAVIRGRAVFTGDFLGFDGHFPQMMVLPGFMHVQAALDLLKMAGMAAELRRVEGAKFSRPILPGQAVVVELLRKGPGRYEVLLVGPEAGMICSRFLLEVAGTGQ
jgi:3-hydroxymyristoyl/3-hydroxydecanoyl-(acyl carrier protein) dehydratase